MGVDFGGSSYAFLEDPWFLAGVLALAVASYALDRARSKTGSESGPSTVDAAVGGRGIVGWGTLLLALALGALLFAGSLADGGREGWPGVIAGAACAGLGYGAVAPLLAGARRRLDEPAARLVGVYADAVALAIAGIAILAPPAGLVSLLAFGWLIEGARRGRQRKFGGLRILR